MNFHPFRYPESALLRRHAPHGYAEYARFKPWLRDEFEFRCVYCLEREVWYPSRDASFSVEHFAPKSINPDLELVYENLVYACLRCNCFKRVFTTILDPSCCTYAEHLRIDNHGNAVALTTDGKDFIDLFHLDEHPAVAVRKEKLLLLAAYTANPENEALAQLFHLQFGYPEDLPNLALLRPHKNANEGSEHNSYFERRRRNQLNSMY